MNRVAKLALAAAIAGLGLPAAAHAKQAPGAVSTDAQAERLYQASRTAIRDRDYGRALELLHRARHRDPRDVRVLNALGVVYDKIGRFDLSERYYGEALAIDPNARVVIANLEYSRRLSGQAAPETGTALARAETPAQTPAAPPVPPAPERRERPTPVVVAAVEPRREPPAPRGAPTNAEAAPAPLLFARAAREPAMTVAVEAAPVLARADTALTGTTAVVPASGALTASFDDPALTRARTEAIADWSPAVVQVALAPTPGFDVGSTALPSVAALDAETGEIARAAEAPLAVSPIQIALAPVEAFGATSAAVPGVGALDGEVGEIVRGDAAASPVFAIQIAMAPVDALDVDTIGAESLSVQHAALPGVRARDRRMDRRTGRVITRAEAAPLVLAAFHAETLDTRVDPAFADAGVRLPGVRALTTTEAPAALTVLNASGRSGVASRTAGRLSQDGVRVERVARAEVASDLSRLEYPAGRLREAWAMARALPFPIELVASDTDGFRLVVGRDAGPAVRTAQGPTRKTRDA